MRLLNSLHPTGLPVVTVADPPTSAMMTMTVTYTPTPTMLGKLRHSIQSADQFRGAERGCRRRMGSRKTETNDQNGCTNCRQNDALHRDFLLHCL